MNETQRIIKYVAMAFAILLAVNIISGIAYGTFSLISVLGGFNHSDKTVNFSEKYADVTSLKVTNTAGEFEIKTGDTLEVVGENVSEKFTCENKNGTLVINNRGNNNNFIWKFNGESIHSKIIITIPKDIVFESFVISNGAGKITANNINCKDLNLTTGAGVFYFDNITAEKAKIDGGVGNIDIKGAKFNDLNLRSGVGNTIIRGEILGDSEIICGVGKLTLKLTGKTDDYNLNIENGIGEIKVNGEKKSDLKWNNKTAENSLDIEGGIGQVIIDFDEN